MLRRYLRACCCAVLCFGVLGAAQQQQPSQPTFTSRAELVLVPVLVKDKSGVHVPGLSRSDFQLEVAGKLQDISTFEEVRPSDAPVRRSLEPDVFTNALADATSQRRLVIIGLDLVNIEFIDQAYAREQMLQYLRENLRETTPIGLLAFDKRGVQVLHDISADPSALMAAVQAITAKQSSNPPAQDAAEGTASLRAFLEIKDLDQHRQSDKAMSTLDALRMVAQQLRGIPGRKSLIWVTSGFPLEFSCPGLEGDRQAPCREFNTAMHLLGDANVGLYPVDARGLLATDRKISYVVGGRMLPGQDHIETMQLVADMTGGRAFYRTNDIQGSIARAVDDSAAYYLLGFYVKRSIIRTGWNKISVRALRPEAEVRARAGFFAPSDKDAKASKAQELAVAVHSPVQYSALPLILRWTGLKGGPKDPRQTFRITIAPGALAIDHENNNRFSFEVAATARPIGPGKGPANFSGQVEGNLTPQLLDAVSRQGASLNQEWQMPAGKYLVRFVVRDNVSGLIGSVTAPLEVNY